MKHSSKRTIAGLMAILMVLAVVLSIPVMTMDNQAVNDPEPDGGRYDNNDYISSSDHDYKTMVIDEFCIPYGIAIGYCMPEGLVLDENKNVVNVLGTDELTEMDKGNEIGSESHLQPYSKCHDYGTPCSNPFDTEEWAAIKLTFEWKATEWNSPIRVRLYDYGKLWEKGRKWNVGLDRFNYVIDETIIYPDTSKNPSDVYTELLNYTDEYYKSKEPAPEPTPNPSPTSIPVINQPKPVDNAATLAPKIQVNDKPMSVQHSIITVTINGAPTELDAIVLTESNGGAHTYYKLRDVGEKVGFDVGWTPETGITVTTR